MDHFFLNLMLDRIDQSINVFFRRIEIERSANGRHNAKVIDQNLGAMLATAAGDAPRIKEGCRVLGKYILNIKGYNAGFGFRIIKNRVPRFFELGNRIFFQAFFVGVDVIHPHTHDVAHCGIKAKNTLNILSAGFKAKRRFEILGIAAHIEFGVHSAPGHEGFHLAQEIEFAIKDADPGRAAKFVTAEGEKINIEILDIDLHMRNRLGTIANEQSAIFMQASTDTANYWGIGNSGWLLDQMPYHYRHILVKLASGKTGEFTQDKIGESADGKGGEATKLSRLIFALAGANYASNVDSNNKRTTVIESLPIRQSFGYLASQYSEDNSGSPASSTHQGETSIVTKVMSSDFVPEFKLGTYAYETLFNQRETATDFGKANAYRIAPGLKKDAGTYVGTSPITTDMIDTNQTLENGTTVYHEIEKTGLGQIPFGAAVALADYADTVKDVEGNTVNEGNEVFYPRNVIFNKYFNKHNICVITPNAIMSNSTIDNTTLGADLTAVADEHLTTDGTVTKQYYKGAYSTLFASLPGFQKDTTNVVSVTSDDGKAENVLTNNEGQIVLAVRVSSSGYQGIHFIVVERSGLSKFGLHTDSSGKVVENADESEAKTNNVATSSQYYTTYLPDSTSYPVNKDNVQTYVDYNKPTSEDLTTRSGNIATAIKGYNSALSTYQFEMLVNNGSITFNDKTLGSKMMSFSTIKRQAAVDSAFTTWSDNWKSYAETLAAQEAARSVGAKTGLGTLLCETTAAEYALPSAKKTTDLWAKGGACYYGTK